MEISISTPLPSGPLAKQRRRMQQAPSRPGAMGIKRGGSGRQRSFGGLRPATNQYAARLCLFPQSPRCLSCCSLSADTTLYDSSDFFKWRMARKKHRCWQLLNLQKTLQVKKLPQKMTLRREDWHWASGSEVDG